MPDSFAWWDEPVRVFADSTTVVAVTRLGRAVELLLGNWPKHGPKFFEARKAALAAYSNPANKRAHAKAQEAFAAAAREAGILAD